MSLQVALNDCQVLLKGLQALSFGDRVSFNVCDTGIVLRNQQHRTCNLSFFLQWDLFEDKPEIDENFAFSVDSKGLIQFLLIFGAEGSVADINYEEEDTFTKMEMSYEGYGCPLILRINKAYHETVCRLATYEATIDSEFEVNEQETINSVIMDTQIKDIWSEFDYHSAELKIGFDESSHKVFFSSESSYARIDVELGRDSDIIMDTKIQKTQEHSYQMKLIQKSLKALSQASRKSIRYFFLLRSTRRCILTLHETICCDFNMEDDEEPTTSNTKLPIFITMAVFSVLTSIFCIIVVCILNAAADMEIAAEKRKPIIVNISPPPT